MRCIPLYFCICSFFLSFHSLSAQKAQAAHWYFGDHYGVNFSSGTPLPDFDNSIYTYEACTTISDKNGNLLFYTNGGGRANQAINGYVWNSNHEIMEGGDLGFDKGGGYSAAQGALSFKKPGTENVYCLFTVDEKETLTANNITFPEGKGARYFEIDMDANGGLGKVTLSNQELFTPAFEYQAATIHDNCEDYWLIIPTGHHTILSDPAAADSFYVYLVDQNGPSLNNKFPIPEGNNFTFDEYGLIKISPDGSRIICGGHLYRFDNSNGVITYQEDLQQSISLNFESPTAFSPNGKLFYEFYLQFIAHPDSATYLQVKQYDLTVDDLSTTLHLLTNEPLISYAKVGGPQLAPDGKLYFLVQNGIVTSPTAMAAINHPNQIGAAADIDLNVVTLSNTPDSRFLQVGTYSDHIFFNEATLNNYGNESMVLDCQIENDVELNAATGMDCYYWSTGATTESIIATEEGFYWVEYWNDCQLEADSFFIEYSNDLFDVDLGPDLQLCNDETVQLVAPDLPEINYLWQNGDSTNSLIVNQTGLYYVSLQSEDCIATDSIYIYKNESPDFDLGDDIELCLSDTLLLEVMHNDQNTYEWQNGAETSFLQVNESGLYSLMISNECGSATDEIEVLFSPCDGSSKPLTPPFYGACPVYVPTAFSPNGDWTNESFKVYSSCEFLDFKLQVFDRWGNQVFGSKDPDAGWDGMLKGQLSQAGAYVYKLNYMWLDLGGQLRLEEVYDSVVLMR